MFFEDRYPQFVGPIPLKVDFTPKVNVTKDQPDPKFIVGPLPEGLEFDHDTGRLSGTINNPVDVVTTVAADNARESDYCKVRIFAY